MTTDQLPASEAPPATMQKCRLVPLSNFVVVEKSTADAMTKGGLAIPDSAKEIPQVGKAVAVGEGALDESGCCRAPMQVKEGDTVVFPKYSGTEVKIDGLDFMIIKESDILAVLRG